MTDRDFEADTERAAELAPCPPAPVMPWPDARRRREADPLAPLRYLAPHCRERRDPRDDVAEPEQIS